MFAACTQTEKEKNPVAPSVLPDIVWTSSGLDSSQVLLMVFLPDSSVLAGTLRGIFRTKSK